MIYAVTFDEHDQSCIATLERLSRPWRTERAAHIRRPGQKIRSLAAGLLLDYALKREGYPSSDHITIGASGKPQSGHVHLSLTHCRGLAACVLTDRPVGIDAEPLRIFTPRLRQRIFTTAEREQAKSMLDADRYLTQLWTLKEAYAKATGEGIAAVLQRAEFCIDKHDIAGPPGCNYQLMEPVSGYSIALAVSTK